MKVKGILLLNFLDVKHFLNELVSVILDELETDLMGHFTVEPANFVGVEIVADDPVSLNAQQRQVAGAVDLDWSSLVDQGVSDVGVA